MGDVSCRVVVGFPLPVVAAAAALAGAQIVAVVVSKFVSSSASERATHTRARAPKSTTKLKPLGPPKWQPSEAKRVALRFPCPSAGISSTPLDCHYDWLVLLLLYTICYMVQYVT